MRFSWLIITMLIPSITGFAAGPRITTQGRSRKRGRGHVGPELESESAELGLD